MRTKKPKQKPKALGSYIFAGGFTIGMREHFDVIAHVENGNYGVATVRQNFPDMPVYTDPKTWPLDDFAGVPVIFGNPACAAWSQAGYTNKRGTDKWKTDPRLNQTLEHFSLLERLQPQIWCTESVTQAYKKGREFFRELETRAMDLGYGVTYFLHDAQWHGLPQKRPRFMMVAHKLELQLPAPNWAPPPDALEAMEPAIAAGLNRTSLPMTATQKRWTKKMLSKVPEGQSLRRHWESENHESKWELRPDGKVKGRPSFGLRRLPVGRPGGAVVGYSLVHPTEDRWIGVEEMGLLSGFPLSYKFAPKRPEAIEDEIARGVCPPIGEYVGRCFAAALEHDKHLSKPVIREVDYRRAPEDPNQMDLEHHLATL